MGAVGVSMKYAKYIIPLLLLAFVSYANRGFINDQLIIGDSTDYLQVDTNGTLSLVGTARTEKDMHFAITRLKKGGVSDPNEGTAGITYVLLFDKATDEEVFIVTEIPHDYADGTDMGAHFHWSPADGDAGNVTWGIEYHILRPETNAVLTGATTTSIIVDAAQSLADEEIKSSNITISGSGVLDGDIIHMRIFRDANASESGASDTYDDDAQLHLFDIEYIVGSLGE